MAKKIFFAKALTDGGPGSLDNINTTGFESDYAAIVITRGDYTYNYTFDADSVLAESSPDVIAPDTGTGRWILQSVHTKIDGIDLNGGTDIGAALADTDLILVDDGGAGTNRKCVISRVKTYCQGIKLDDFATPDDNVDLNASTSAHGLLNKLSDVVTEFLNGQGSFSVPDHDALTNFVANEHLPGIDEDNMASNSNVHVPTQQSVKAYVDASSSAWDGDIDDMDIDGADDIGAALADSDLIVVDDGATGTNRKSAMSRVKTYCQGIKLDDLAAPDDNVDLNASTSKHGLLKKLSGDSSDFLDGEGNFSTPPFTSAGSDEDIQLSDGAGGFKRDIGFAFDVTNNKLKINPTSGGGSLVIDETGYPIELSSNATQRRILIYMAASDYVELKPNDLSTFKKGIDCSSGPFLIRRVSQSSEPTPDSGELMIWRDSDDGKVYLMYEDATSGTKKVELT